MTSLPAIATLSLEPATPDELRAALKALFDQFPATDGDPKGKFLGYVMALEGEPKWAVERAAAAFIKGDVASHDGRFLPSSAELARVVRGYSSDVRKYREREERQRPFRRFVREIPKTDWKLPWPGLETIRSWKLPPGTEIIAANATVVYPNGAVEGWLALHLRSLKQDQGEAA